MKVLHPAEFHSLHTSYLKVNELMSYVKNNYIDNDIIYTLLLDDETMSMYAEFHEEYQNNFVMDELHKYYINEITGRLLKKGISNDVDELVDLINKPQNSDIATAIDEVDTEIFSISADISLAAISNDAFVRVEFSKNKFITK